MFGAFGEAEFSLDLFDPSCFDVVFWTNMTNKQFKVQCSFVSLFACFFV